MVSSACSVLLNEPRRFLPYIFADKQIRESIIDEDSFIRAVEQAFKSDPTLVNIFKEMKDKKDNIKGCLKNIVNTSDIQTQFKRNKKRRRDKISRKVKKQKPRLTGRS